MREPPAVQRRHAAAWMAVALLTFPALAAGAAPAPSSGASDPGGPAESYSAPAVVPTRSHGSLLARGFLEEGSANGAPTGAYLFASAALSARLSAAGAEYRLPGGAGGTGASLHLSFDGSDPVSPQPSGRLEGTTSYLVGAPSTWRPGLSSFSSVIYPALYPGIDLVWSSVSGSPKWELHVATWADPEAVRLRFSGSTGLSIATDGSLLVAAAAATLREERPVSWSGASPVECAYVIVGDAAVQFRCGGWDRAQPLVIDPLITSSTLGGTGSDYLCGTGVDAAGNIYIGGETFSADFPGSALPVNNSTAESDLFVVKLDPTGSRLLSVTFVGGNKTDSCQAFAVDPAGEAFLGGQATSPDFPVLPGAVGNAGPPQNDAFITKVAANGSTLLYSILMGGTTAFDQTDRIAVDGGGNATLMGLLRGDAFPASAPGLNVTTTNNRLFAARLSADGQALAFAAYFADASVASAADMAIDAAGSTYICGWARDGLVTTPGAYQPFFVPPVTAYSEVHAFVMKLAPDGASLDYSTYLGADGEDECEAITVAADGSAIVAGQSIFEEFPRTPGSYSNSPSTFPLAAFIARLAPAGDALTYAATVTARSTGSTGFLDIAAAPDGTTYAAGYSSDPLAPTSPGAAQPSLDHGSHDGYLLSLSPAGDALQYASFIGGSDSEAVISLAIGRGGDVILAGETRSPDFPLLPPGAAFGSPSANGSRPDLFLQRWTANAAGPPAPPNLSALGAPHGAFVSWEEPEDPARAPLLGYDVFRGLSPTNLSAVATLPPEARSYADGGLLDGLTYWYSVSARSTVGAGSRARPAAALAASVPGPPLAPSASARADRVTLSWQPPADDGGSPVTSYAVYRFLPGTGFVLLAGGLSNTTFVDASAPGGLTSAWAISAANARGEGPLSVSVAARPGIAPAAPQSLAAVPSSDGVSLTWQPPADTSVSPVLYYTVYRSDIPGSPVRAMARVPAVGGVGSLQFNDTNVSRAVSYTYAVSASSSLGEGPLGVAATSRGFSVPLAPAGLRQDGLFAPANMSWDPPPQSAAEEIVGYVIWRGSSLTAFTRVADVSSDRRYSDNTLAPGGAAWFAVSAVGIGGEGPRGAPLRVALLAAPDPPQGLSVEARPGYNEVRWRAAGGHPPDAYRLYRSVGGGASTLVASVRGALAYVDTTATPGSQVDYRVTAVVGPLESAPAGPVGATAFSAPSSPRNLAATAGDGSVALRWDAPVFDGGVPLAGYRVVRYAPGEPPDTTDVPAGTTSLTQTGLGNGVPYSFEVFALGSVAMSATSASATATPQAPSFLGGAGAVFAIAFAVSVLAGAGLAAVMHRSARRPPEARPGDRRPRP